MESNLPILLDHIEVTVMPLLGRPPGYDATHSKNGGYHCYFCIEQYKRAQPVVGDALIEVTDGSQKRFFGVCLEHLVAYYGSQEQQMRHRTLHQQLRSPMRPDQALFGTEAHRAQTSKPAVLVPPSFSSEELSTNGAQPSPTGVQKLLQNLKMHQKLRGKEAVNE